MPRQPAGGTLPPLVRLAQGLQRLRAESDPVQVRHAALVLARDLCGAASARFLAPDGSGLAAAPASTDPPLPATLVAQAGQSGQIVFVPNARQAAPSAADPAACPWQPESVLCLPLRCGQELMGLICVEGFREARPDVANVMAALDVLAGSTAQLLHNMRLREQLREGGLGQRKAESALAFEQKLLRTLVENIPFRIYAKDRSSRFLFGNNRMARLAGLSGPSDLIGKTDFDFFPAELAAKYFADEQQVLQSGQALLDYEELVEDQDTGELGWTVTTKVLLRDADGAVTGIVGIGYDVTQRKQMEARLVERTQALEEANATLQAEKAHQQVLIGKLQDMRGQLLQSEKMASIGLLAAGVAHEINNPVAFISSNFAALERDSQKLLDLVAAYEALENALPAQDCAPLVRLKQEIGLEDIRLDLGDLLRESMEGLNRVKHIVQGLRDFSRVGGTEKEMANLEQGLDSTLNVAWNEIKYKAEVVKEYGGIPEVVCFSSQINQVFLNLLVNAAQAMEGNGRIVIRTGCDADQVWVEIEDNGSGIAPEHLDRIFEPFFTTKPVGKGTGLGLSIVYGIVQAHNGKLEVDSELGRGTRFRMILPRTEEADASS